LVFALSQRPDGNSGVHTHIDELRQHMERRGENSALITPFSWGGWLRYPVFGLRSLLIDRLSPSAGILWYRHWHEVFLQLALARHLSALGDCVVYAQDPIAARAALRSRRGPGQRVVMAVHFRISQADEYADGGGISRPGRVYQSVRRAERATISQVDGLVCVSAWGRQVLVDWLPEAERVPYAIIPNFVETRPAAQRETREADLVSTGRLEPAKNQEFLLRVLDAAKHRGRIYTLDLFGDGPSREDLEKQVRSMRLTDQVRFRGFCPDVREALPGYRAYVHSSRSESLPLAIIEAMAAGLPVVAGNTGGISEMYEDGVEGRFWDLDDPESAAAVLDELMQDGEGLTRMASAARARVSARFERDVVAPKLLSFLRPATESGASNTEAPTQTAGPPQPVPVSG
jgi:glycosyltransferase involved in cell wall biosynthesis